MSAQLKSELTNGVNPINTVCDLAPPEEKKEQWEFTQAVEEPGRAYEKLLPHLQTPKGPKRNHAVPFQRPKELHGGGLISKLQECL